MRVGEIAVARMVQAVTCDSWRHLARPLPKKGPVDTIHAIAGAVRVFRAHKGQLTFLLVVHPAWR